MGNPARTGNRLFGYTRDGEIVPKEADITRRMAKDILKFHSVYWPALLLAADLPLPDLHAQQVRWKAEQAESFEEYLRRKDPQATVSRAWPVEPQA